MLAGSLAGIRSRAASAAASFLCAAAIFSCAAGISRVFLAAGLDHAKWLDRQRFEKMKPALVKIYLDAFWWWDDYVRSAATSLLLPALRRIADQQQDELWTNDLDKFSDHWVSSWDEAVLRANPSEWRLVLDAIRHLLGMFGLQRGRIPRDPALRRIYILLCQFYGKALWYAGEADATRAEEADKWLAAAAAACVTRDDEEYVLQSPFHGECLSAVCSVIAG